MKINTTVLEHYFVSLIVAGVSIWQTGNHSLKGVAFGAITAVLGPVAIATYHHLKESITIPPKPPVA